MRIPFNKPFLAGRELDYIRHAVESGRISGGGEFTRKCQDFFEVTFGLRRCLLTTSCTDALEMAALLCRIEPGDEVIVPSYTFVSTANAFALRGAKIVFADSEGDRPHVSAESVAELITNRTKAVVVVHYAGVACDMKAVLETTRGKGITLIEDAAQAVCSHYCGRPLGGLGDLGAFSFHETKNVIAGEGGMIVVSNKDMRARAEVLWEKGTNRAAFSRGETKKYEWIDLGSSYLPSELTAAFLFAQLERLDWIQSRRLQLWNAYWAGLQDLETSGCLELPRVPDYATNNGHLFSLVLRNRGERDDLLGFL